MLNSNLEPNNTNHIPVAGPDIDEADIRYVTEAVTHAWYQGAGCYIAEFESEFCRYLNRKFAIALPSCTSGIHLALLAAGIGPGDEVIVPDINWIASVAPITYVGATPVFADVDPVLWCLCPDSVASFVNDRTKAIIPVNLYGAMPDYTALKRLAQEHDLFLLEDAAESHGSSFKGVQAGGWGDASVFSFHASKTMTTGEGGMLLTDDEVLYKQALFLRDHGRMPEDKSFRSESVGYKYKMTDLQAALGCTQLKKLPLLTAKKQQIFKWYEAALSGCEGFTLNQTAPELEHTYWMTTLLFNQDVPFTASELITFLKAHEVDSRPMFSPLSDIPAFSQSRQADIARNNNKVAYEFLNKGVNLPSALKLTEDNVQYVCDLIKKFMQT